MSRTHYPTLFSRLVANTAEPENDRACWVWIGKKQCRFGYGRVNVYVPGLGKAAQMSAHVVAFLCMELGSGATANDIYLANLELRASGLELDHLCVTAGCIFPDHLDLVTHSVNCARKYRR